MAYKTAFQPNAFQPNAFQIENISSNRSILDLPINCVMEMNQISYRSVSSEFQVQPMRMKIIPRLSSPGGNK